MKKQLLLLVCLAAIPLFAQQDQVSFSLDAPENVVAGNAFEVTLIFNKGNLKDYSRFSQELPAGFTAENIISPNADFTFDEQRIRIIWLKLPAEQEIEVRYRIEVDKRLKGQLELDGMFAYVVDGERAYLELDQPVAVEILPNPSIDPNQVVSIEEFPNINKPANMTGEGVSSGESKAFATMIRQAPVVESNGIAYISLLVRKPENANFLKIEESIPGGYSFEEIESAGATVSQAASMAKFVWMKPPSKNIFVIRYRLVPILEKDQDPIVIDGNMSFNKDGQTQVIKPAETELDLAGLTAAQKEELLETGSVSGEIASREKAEEAAGKTPGDRETGNREKEDVVKSTPEYEPAGKIHTTDYRKSTGTSVVKIESLGKQEGVYFRVQVAAVRNPYFARTYFADFDLLRDVRVEKSGGWSRYTVGSFGTYREAEAMKDRIGRETPVRSAFIVAYRDGNRVPVSEVLKQ